MKRKRESTSEKEIPEIFEVPTSGIEHPEAPYTVLPKHEFTIGIIAPPGAGKTHLICNLLKFYERYFHYILVISPSLNNDEKWEWIQKQPLLSENKPLKKFLKKLAEESEGEDEAGHGIIKAPKGHRQPGKEEKEIFDPKIPKDCFMDTFKESKLEEVWNAQQEMILFLKAHGKTKHMANRVLIIFDDMVGSSLFSNARDNFFKMMNANRRHKSSSMIMVSQAYKQIPYAVRTMWSSLVLFRSDSSKEMEVIHEEFPMGVKDKKVWFKMMDYCVKEPHSFLYYNMQKEHDQRVRKNFNELIKVDDEDSDATLDGGSDDETKLKNRDLKIKKRKKSKEPKNVKRIKVEPK